MKRIWILTSLLLLPTISSGASPEPLRLEDVLQEVWSESPQLRGQQEQVHLANGDRWRRYIFNEPQFQYSDGDDHTSNSYGLSLTTSFPGKSVAFSQLDTAKAHGQKAEYEAKKYDLARTTTQAYLDCASAQATFELQKVASADLETVFQTLKTLYETGHSTQAEKIGAELQWRQSQLDLATAQDKQDVFCRKLAALLPKDPSLAATRIPLPDDLSPEIVADLGAYTADQHRAHASFETAAATADTAWWSQAPDLTFNVSRNHYLFLPGSPSGKEWTTTYGVSLTIPLFFPFHEAVEVSRAKSQAMIDRNAAQLQKVAADSDRLDGAREYQRSRQRLHELRAKDLTLAEALVESTFSAYRAGKLGYAELVLSRKTLTDLRSQDIQLRVSIINSHLRCLNQCSESF